MRKANLLVMLVALGMVAWAVPVARVQAASNHAVLNAPFTESPPYPKGQNPIGPNDRLTGANPPREAGAVENGRYVP